jgi:hypothetical protein
MIPRYIFDRWGTWIGNVEDDSRYCDPHGHCVGKVMPDGMVYDQKGACRGHFDVQGQLWDAHGTSLGGMIPNWRQAHSERHNGDPPQGTAAHELCRFTQRPRRR